MKVKKLVVVTVIVMLIVGLFLGCEDTPLKLVCKTMSGFYTWAQMEKLSRIGGGADDDNFGFSVAITDKYAAVGVPSDGSGTNVNMVYLYSIIDGDWTQKSILIGNSHANEAFGWGVDIDGDFLIVGAPYYENAGSWVGAVYIYKIKTDGTCELPYIIYGETDGDFFGGAVSISDNTVLVGANQNGNGGNGIVYFFERGGSSWINDVVSATTVGTSSISQNTQAGALMGSSVDISGSFAVVGARGWPVGKVFVFNNLDGTWGNTPYEDDSIELQDGSSGDNFGYSVSMSDEYLLIGASGNGGAVYIYEIIAGQWNYKGELEDPEKIATDGYGKSVAIDNQWAFVGSAGADASGTDSGSITIFIELNGEWIFYDYLVSDDISTGDNFGSDIDIYGNLIICSAHMDDFIGTSNEGSAYIIKNE
jgi:hypothetical protein